MTLYYATTTNANQKTLDAALNSGVTASATFNNTTGIQNKKGVFVVDRVDTNGVLTPNKREYIGFTGTSGSTVVTLTRNIDGGGSDQDHAVGAIVEFGPDAVWADGVMDALDNAFDSTGAVDGTKIVTITGTQTITGDKTFSGTSAFSGSVTFTGTVTGAGAATWTSFAGAYASGTTLTVAGTDVTGIMKKGVILKWLSSADAFKTGMVVSSSFSTDTTITIVGSTAASGDKTFYYGPFADIETFIIPGTLAAGTDIAKTFYAEEEVYPISCDAYVKTAGTTNATEFDINDDGTTIFGGTSASIASAGTSDLNNAASAPTTVIAKDSLVTVDINSVSTTAPVEAYIKLFYYPKSLVSRT